MRYGVGDDEMELCKAVYPPSKVLKLLEVLKLNTNGFAAIGRADTVQQLWPSFPPSSHHKLVNGM